MGPVRGLSTDAFHSFSLSLRTIRRACPAENRLSGGGLPVEVAAVGERRLWARCAFDMWPGVPLEEEAREWNVADEMRRFAMADRTLNASASLAEKGLLFSVSEPELIVEELLELPLLLLLSTWESELRLRALLVGSRGRSGELSGSLSEEDRDVMTGGRTDCERGEPSAEDFLERNPALKRLVLVELTSGSGGAGTGEQPVCSVVGGRRVELRIGGRRGRVTSFDETSGVVSYFRGVFSNSAKVPSSVSSFHLTTRFKPFTGDRFFFGVKDTPFLALPSMPLRFGEPLMGEAAT